MVRGSLWPPTLLLPRAVGDSGAGGIRLGPLRAIRTRGVSPIPRFPAPQKLANQSSRHQEHDPEPRGRGKARRYRCAHSVRTGNRPSCGLASVVQGQRADSHVLSSDALFRPSASASSASQWEEHQEPPPRFIVPSTRNHPTGYDLCKCGRAFANIQLKDDDQYSCTHGRKGV